MRRRFIRNREAVDEYFTIESLEDECVISLTDRAGMSEGIGGIVWYSINNSHWTWDNLSKNPITLKKGYKVRFKNNTSMGTFVITKKCKILGSIMSLRFMDDFKNKTSLESHKFPELFKGCNTIVSVDKGFLPATTLSKSCYQGMFYGCTSLTSAPELPATTLAPYCYDEMFYGCTNLNYIKMLATDLPLYGYSSDWVYGVSPTGTFIKSKDATWDTTPGALGNKGVPAGWTVVNDGEEEGGNDFGIEFPLYLEFDYCEDTFLGAKYCERAADELGVKVYNYVKEIVDEYGEFYDWQTIVGEQVLDMLGIEIYFENSKVIGFYNERDTYSLQTNHDEYRYVNIDNNGLIFHEA